MFPLKELFMVPGQGTPMVFSVLEILVLVQSSTSITSVVTARWSEVVVVTRSETHTRNQPPTKEVYPCKEILFVSLW